MAEEEKRLSDHPLEIEGFKGEFLDALAGAQKVVMKAQAPAALQYALTKVPSHCAPPLIPNHATLLAKSRKIQFWDVREDGLIPITAIPGAFPSRPGATIKSELGNANAVTLYGSNNSIQTISPNVVLGEGFYLKAGPYQGLILVHELLHYAMQQIDRVIFRQRGIIGNKEDNESSAFTRWLARGCRNETKK